MSLPHNVCHRSVIDDAPPEPRFDLHQGGEARCRSSALYILDLLRGGHPATLPEDLALAAADAIETRDSFQRCYHSALEKLGAAQKTIARQRETIAYLMRADHVEAA
jgi:hypothetical protein